jgi:isoaspartyl peptidase/L-asparaginase-like protein (Ntn-hydrolase superfamily)
MKRIFLVASLAFCLAAVPLNSETLPTTPDQIADLLVQRVLTDPTAYGVVSNLATRFPRRFDGSDVERQTADWFTNEVAPYADRVWSETFTIPGWQRGEVEKCEIVDLNGKTESLSVTALGGTKATPTNGIEFPVVVFTNYFDLTNNKESLSNTIVLVTQEMDTPTHGGHQYGKISAIRMNGASYASRHGARGFLLSPAGIGDPNVPHTGSLHYADDAPRIPAAALSRNGARQLADLRSKQPGIKVRLVLTPLDLGDIPSQNVVAEIRGRDTNKIVILAAHYDCWDITQGALDDGAGVAILVAMMKQIHDLPPSQRPKYTIRVIFFGSEEMGLLGGKAYIARHRTELKEKVVMITEPDDGQGPIYCFRTHVQDQFDPGVKKIAEALGRLGIPDGESDAEGTSESSLFAKENIPVANLDLETSEYFRFHHTPNDTLDKINPELLNKTAAAYTVFAYLSAEYLTTTAAPRFGLIVHGGAGSLKNKDPEVIRKQLSDAEEFGYGLLAQGSNSMDVVAAVLSRIEDTGSFNAGKGAVPNRAGHYEVDASIMIGDGSTNAAGAVIGVSRIKNPILLARDVGKKSKHLALAGKGAEQFAKTEHYELVPKKYFDSPQKRKDLQEFLRKERAAQRIALLSPAGHTACLSLEMGTIGCCVLDQKGDLAAGTSTGGIIGKLPGRVGDSPIIGAGTWAKNATCAVSCTGIGEYFIRANAAADVSARMEYGKKSVQEAVTETLTNIGNVSGGVGGLIAIDSNGNIAFDFNTAQMPRAWHVSGSNAVVALYKEPIAGAP